MREQVNRALVAIGLLAIGSAISAAQYSVDAKEADRKPGDLSDEAIYEAARGFASTHGWGEVGSQVVLRLQVGKSEPRHWLVRFGDSSVVEVEPATGRVLSFVSEAYQALPAGRDPGPFLVQNEDDALREGMAALTQLVNSVTIAGGSTRFTRESAEAKSSAVYDADALVNGVPALLPLYVALDADSGKVVEFMQPAAFVVESDTQRLSSLEAEGLALAAYATMAVVGDRGVLESSRPTSLVLRVPASRYGVANPRTEDVLRLRLAWRVRFGHHSVDIDAATGQVLGEYLGRGSQGAGS